MTQAATQETRNTLNYSLPADWNPAPDETGIVAKSRAAAMELFLKMELPTKSDESWRKTNLDLLGTTTFQPGKSITELARECMVPGEPIPDGVRLLSLEEAARDPDLLDRVTEALGDFLEDAKRDLFGTMNGALSQRTLVVHARAAKRRPDDDSAGLKDKNPPERPLLRLRHRLDSGNALIHRVLVVLDRNAELTLLEEFEGENGEGIRLWNPVTQVYSGENSHLKYVEIRRFGDSDVHFRRFLSHQKRDSSIHLSVVHTGGILGKSLYEARILEEGTHFRGIGIGTGKGHEFHNMEMIVTHMADHSESSLLYKTVLQDRAHSVFDGNLHIPKGHKHIESIQVNNNILLSRKARAESMPRLVTQSDAVSCEHGATVGELDEEALFFLMARGLAEVDARVLLIQGFYSSIVEEIPLPDEDRQAIVEWIGKEIRT